MLGEMLRRVREMRPIVHSITNYVTANDCANVLLAAGASPIMSDDPGEVSDIVELASGLCINIGTLNDSKLKTMLIAGRRANELGRPVVLDPVGAGSSRHRTLAARRLLEEVKFAVIRGNLSEIKILAGDDVSSGGVDASKKDRDSDDIGEAVAAACRIIKETDTVVSVSGAVDVVTNGRGAFIIKNGHPMMRAVTGTGCQLSALTAAFVAASPEDTLTAAAAAAAAMGVCGELAHERLLPGEGSGTYRARIIDAVYDLLPEVLEKHARYETR